MTEKKLYRWTFYRGCLEINPDKKVSDIELSYSLIDLISQKNIRWSSFSQERDLAANHVLYQLGLDGFDIAADQLPWLFVQSDMKSYGWTRDNKIVAFELDNKILSLDDPGELTILLSSLALTDRENSNIICH